MMHQSFQNLLPSLTLELIVNKSQTQPANDVQLFQEQTKKKIFSIGILFSTSHSQKSILSKEKITSILNAHSQLYVRENYLKL